MSESPVKTSTETHELAEAPESLPESQSSQDDAAAPQPAADSAETDEALNKLACQVEALIVTSSRAVSPQRLAIALGLAPPEEEPTSTPDPEREMVVPQEGVEVKKTRKRPRKTKADGPTPSERIASSVALLNKQYELSGRTFRIEAVSGGYRLMTLPAYRGPIAALQGITSSAKLSKPAVETLAIIAYRQPVTRAQLEAIRGVACGEVLKSLLDRRLVTVAGRAEELGRPLLYATSKAFLDAFGLASLKDLPTPGELGLRAERDAD